MKVILKVLEWLDRMIERIATVLLKALARGGARVLGRGRYRRGKTERKPRD